MIAAIIGAGKMGRKKAEACKELSIQIKFIDDLVAEKALELCNKFGGRFAHWKEWINDSELDTVFVCTSHDALAEVSVAVLNAGKHLVVEKPAGKSSYEIQRIIDAHNNALKKSFVAVKVSLNHRYHPMIAKAKKLADEGVLGELLYMTCEYGHGGREGMTNEWRCIKSKSGGGELLDQGSHVIDFYEWFFGSPDSVHGYAPTLVWKNEKEPVEDNCFFTLKNKRGFGQFHVSWTMWKNDFQLKLTGTNGVAVITGLGRSYGIETLKVYKKGGEGKLFIEDAYEGEDLSFVDELKYFLECVNKKEQPDVGLRTALESIKVVERIYSLQEGAE